MVRVLFMGRVRGTLREGSIPAKLRFRTVPDVAVLNSPGLELYLDKTMIRKENTDE